MLRVLLGCLLLLLNSCHMEGDTENDPRSAYLFLIFAKQGDLHYAADDSNEIYLTLRRLSTTVTHLSAQPELHVGMLSLTQFLKRWDEGQVLVSDQSGILYVADKQSGLIHVRLQQPRYDAIADSLTFEVTLMEPAESLRADKITDIAVYIDAMATL